MRMVINVGQVGNLPPIANRHAGGAYSLLLGFAVLALVLVDELESLVFVSEDFAGVPLSDFVVDSDAPFPESVVLLPSDSPFLAPFPPPFG
jgi:hypothetical protein